jgi:ectoine hydroxylase-related dioxygenase (phytanoyl-CoA dioxygenase family)
MTEALNTLVQEGYYAQHGLIQEPLLSRLRDALDAVALQEREQGTGGVSHSERFGGQFIRHLYDKHEAFHELLTFAPILDFVRSALGPAVRARLSARITVPSDANQQTEWHVHTAPPPDPMPPFYAFPHSLDVLVYLDGANKASGLLQVLPQSHRDFRVAIQAADFSDQPGQVEIELPPGAGVFIHNHLWHRATLTTPQGHVRRLLALTYYPSWSRGSLVDGPPPPNGKTQRLIETGDREILELLGLK